MTIPEFTRKFATVEACLEYLEHVRWDGKPYCPCCGSGRKIYRYGDSIRFRCADCKRIFRVITGTIFGDSPIKLLPKWFLAIYIETTHNKGISSPQLAESIGVTLKTAWFMLQRIRNATGKGESLLGGQVEIDETYLGGKEKNRHANAKKNQGRGPVGKTVAFGMKERGGEARAFHVASAAGKDIAPVVIQNVALGATMHADDARAYGGLDSFYDIRRVNHSAKEYVRGRVHTNGIEGLWAMTKRCYMGTHHWWSVKHTQLYLNTICYRQNTRKMNRHAVVARLLNQGMHARLTYRELVHGDSDQPGSGAF